MNSNSTEYDSLIDHLLIIPADQIQYDTLATSTLSGLATQMEEPFIATSALGELAQRSQEETIHAAERILTEKVWDAHLTAFALTLLYDRDPAKGIAQMEKHIVDCRDPTILAAMMDNVLTDLNATFSTTNSQLAQAISRQVAALPLDAFEDSEQRLLFLRRFGDQG